MGRIWILNHYAVLPNHGGGTRHFDFARELTKRGYNVTIFASSYNHFIKKEMLEANEYSRIEIVEGIKFVWLKTKPYYKSNGLLRILNMCSYFFHILKVYKHYDEPDIVIGSSVHPFAWLAAYFISKRTKAKFLCEIRDLWPQTLIDMGSMSHNNPVVVLFRAIERYIYKRASSIITLLPGAYSYITKLGVPENKIVYIPNGVDVERQKQQALQNAETLDKQMRDMLDKYFCCIYIGSHGIANSLDTLVKSAQIIDNQGYDEIKYIFVGNGTEKERLIQYCEKSGIANISFFDSISKDLVPAVLSMGKINLISMQKSDIYKYGISLNKLFDYMYSAKPIVFAGNVYCNAIEAANAGIIVEAEEPQRVADAVLKLYNMSEEERSNIGNNGKAYVEKNHDIKKLVDKLIECFS